MDGTQVNLDGLNELGGPFGMNFVIAGVIVAAALGGYGAWRLSGRRVWPAVAGAVALPAVIITIGKAREAAHDRRQADYIAKYGDPWKRPTTAPQVQPTQVR